MITFNNGTTLALFKSFETVFYSDERFMICKMGCARIEAASFTNLAGILSVPVLLEGLRFNIVASITFLKF